MSTRRTIDDAGNESSRIGPDDPRYLAVVDKRFNERFSARPDYVRLVSSTDHVISAVGEAVAEGRRLAVTSGGDCLEGFVSNPEVRVIIDISPMKSVYYDAKRRAVAVEAGATVGETFQALHEAWGVVIPLGEYPEIGMGGDVVGGRSDCPFLRNAPIVSRPVSPGRRGRRQRAARRERYLETLRRS